MVQKERFSKEKYFEKYGHDEFEITKDQLLEMEYPKPLNRYYAVYEANNQAVEPVYHFSLDTLRNLGFPVVDKITDAFAAAELSTLYGAAGTKLGASQDKVMSILRLLSELIRSIPVYVREVRWLNERLDFHEKAKRKDALGEQAEITLKGIFMDLVEGGTKNPSSVLGLTQQVGFPGLSDHFVKMRRGPEESEEAFAKRLKDLEQDYNPQVVSLLRRKLMQYETWKKHNYEELKTRQQYLLQYLKQYYSNVRLYMNWVKPYLKVIKRLGMDMNKTASPDLVAAFEGSMVEVELLGKMLPKGNKDHYACVLINITFLTKPTMPFTSPDYHHRGPIHIGNAKVHWRSYAWTDDDIAEYKRLREADDIELLLDMDETLKAAMEGVPEVIDEWLRAQGVIKEEEVKEEGPPPRPSGLMDPFVSVVKGFYEPFKEVFKNVGEGVAAVKRDLGPGKSGGDGDEKKEAEKMAKKLCYLHYKFFKKAHGMASF